MAALSNTRSITGRCYKFLSWLLNRRVSLFSTRSATVRRYKMLNWRFVLAPRLERRFEAVRRSARQAQFSENVYVHVDRDHRSVSLFLGVHPVGLSLQVQYPKTTAIEGGAALVFSQAVTGNVAVFLYPYDSEFMHQPDKLIVWRVFNGPNDVTLRAIDAALVDAFRYWRVSSVLDLGSWWDRWRIKQLRRRDRYRSEGKAMAAQPSWVARVVSEFLAWWPVAAVLAFSGIVTIVTGWHDFTGKVRDALHTAASPGTRGANVATPNDRILPACRDQRGKEGGGRNEQCQAISGSEGEAEAP
ncbi:hypothetical protein WI72_04050 [Burkholderia ubonensis]|uniref:hypothetical protein n=1 Tax=Burkholderia ubonensis TaxID=101571 RepID=UPI00075B7C70|nr:hypothetical protein [Burkholderia ubonensis]KVC47538.1 hypothetical protein WI72_04050 [Burkholderia ubonensis]KVD97073.1 hypothetical protein WI90_33750 [Burkholderia ubonensis]